jgi:GNAT superfamily N-acetyltransferase
LDGHDVWDLFDSENPEDDATAAVERTASADYPVLEEILHVRPPLPHAVKIGRKENPTQIQAEGGWIHDYMHPLEGGAMQRIMNQPAYNWCRFRTERSHCMLPEVPDTENAKIAGYEVWFVKDRGFCPRVTWDAQEQCHVGEPGPNSGHPNALIECTKDWKDGGQRGGTPGVYVDHLASKEGSWADVRTKAARIRREGGVRVIANAGDTITAQVQGDNHVYQTSLMREPGKKAVAMWECSCPWSTYSWGRSGRWRKYEGRMCAHAMALVYEASAQEWGGQEIAEGAGFDEPVYHYEAPPQGEWRLDPVPDPNDFGHAASLHTAYDNSGKRGTKVWRGFLTWDIYPPDNRPLAERVEMGDHMLPANQALAQRFHDGTVTAQDLLKIVDTDSVGIYWAEAGPHPDENNRTGEEVARSYAGGERGVWPGHGGVDTSRLLASSWDERGPAGTEWADKYIHRGIGTAMIVLVAELGADAEEEDGEGMLELEEGHPLNLLEIQYNAGWGWHTVSVGGRRVTANVPRGTIQATAKGNSIFPTAIDPLTGEVYLNGQQITKYPSWDPNVGISDFEGGWIWTDAARHNDALLFEASADEAFLRTLRIEESGDSADQTRKLTVYEPGGSVVGFIEIYGRYYKKAKGQVQGIDVFPEYQRRGVATWLFKQAENWWPDLDVKHSTDLTDDGKAWKRSLGALDPERLGQCFNLALRYVRDHDGWKLAHGSIGGPGSALADPENPDTADFREAIAKYDAGVARTTAELEKG